MIDKDIKKSSLTKTNTVDQLANRKTLKAIKEGDKLIEKFKKSPESARTYSADEAIKEMESW